MTRNHLADETSPYLLQHADNPVHWYPWGETALARAKAENKPIFLSIGYAACHWCHVMAHESFEDEATAALMNADFINVKVDREERPDVDAIYMAAVQALTGHGGWPMSVFLTPEGEPFYGGTYYPVEPRYGMPSFKQVLQSIARAWRDRETDVRDSARNIAAQLDRPWALTGGNPLNPQLLEDAVSELSKHFDKMRGGFGQAPKFPPSMTIEFLLRMYLSHGDATALQMAEVTLEQMALGGMYDQLGGGFARYSTDAEWLVPHFEKMLYDNALLARAYLHAWQITGKPLYRRIVEETCDWVLREMRDPAGGFYSSYDADSEGEEGKFYVWSLADVESLLGDGAALFCRAYDVTQRGNWERTNILRRVRSDEALAQTFGMNAADVAASLAASRRTLLAARAERVWPGLDDKVLTAWNGLMIAALAEAGAALGRPDYTDAAVTAAALLAAEARRPDGRLLRSWKAGAGARYNAYLEDYAYLADGLLALYQATFDERWFTWARALTGRMLDHFVDPNGGFFDTSNDHEQLIQRPKEIQDNATPSANAMAVRVLQQLALYTGEMALADRAEEMISSLYNVLGQYPRGFSHWLCGAWFVLSEPRELAIVGDPADPATRRLIDVARRDFRPNLIVAVGRPGTVPLLHDRTQLDGAPTAYVCRNFVCNLPVTTPAALAGQLAA